MDYIRERWGDLPIKINGLAALRLCYSEMGPSGLSTT